MASKRRASKRRASKHDDDAWREVARDALRAAIGVVDGVFLVDSLEGAPPSVTVSLAIAAPPDLVDTLRRHPLFDETVRAIREGVARALPGTELALRLVPAAIETTKEMLALALDAGGRSDVADELSLPPSPERAPPVDDEEGRSMEVTSLRIRQIEATSLRRFAVLQGRALPPDGEAIVPNRNAPARDEEAMRDESREEPVGDARALRSWHDWFPTRSLMHESAKPRFWLIARLGSVVSVRKAQRMRSLVEKRYEHADEACARADFDRRVSEKLAAGWQDIARDSFERTLLYHEPVIPDMSRDLVRRAARALLASKKWSHTLSAQALVRTLATTGDAAERDLARALVARIQQVASEEAARLDTS